MKYCINCGASVLESDNFCKECGQPMNIKKYCENCGTPIKSPTDVCKHCGHDLEEGNLSKEGKTLATLSVIFGSLGFYPFIFIGSVVGFILALIGLKDPNNDFKSRSKIGFWLSIGSFAMWILIMYLVFGYFRYIYTDPFYSIIF